MVETGAYAHQLVVPDSGDGGACGVLIDESTPAEVWQEYEAQKRALDALLTHRIRDLHRKRDDALDAICEALGCGVPLSDLTDAQQRQQAEAIARWRPSTGCTG